MMTKTPMSLVDAVSKRHPGLYNLLDLFRNAKESGKMDWPDYCFLPISAAFESLRTQGLSPLDCAEAAAEAVACYTWRRNKVVYRFHPDLARTLAEQASSIEDTDVLPSSLLMSLPYECVYIQCPGILDEYVDGFFVWVEHDDHSAPELRIQYVIRSMEYSFPAMLHLVPGTILDCIEDTNHTIRKNGGTETAHGIEDARMLFSAIQLVLYLVSESAELTSRPTPVRKKAGKGKGRHTPLPKVKSVDVGFRIGATLRKARTASANHKENSSTTSTSSKRPHARRGHWHHYWTGARESPQRRLILKWTAPTFIHGGDDAVTIMPVK